MFRRIIVLFSVILLLCGALMAQLVLIASNGGYVKAAASQSVYRLELCRTRGTVYDRHLRTLAGGVRRYTACVAPSPAVKARLRHLMEDEDFFAIESMLDNGTPFAMPVRDGSLDGPGVEVVPVKKRSVIAAEHIIGTVAPDGHGASGIERAYDRFLSMQDGEITATYLVAANGGSQGDTAPDIFDSTHYSDAGVVLTLDLDIQLAAEEICSRLLERGAVIVMELPGGEIRACVSRPGYSPDDIASALDADHSPLIDRALCAYDVGSVFKLVTAAAALEAGVSPDRTYVCEGHTQVGNNVFNCSAREGHGELDMTDALAVSCNTYFIDLASQIGGGAILDMAEKLGFGTELTVAGELCSESGCLPSAASLSRPAALANLSFGQGELLATPMHIAMLTGTVACGGSTVHPTLYAGRVDMELERIDTAPPPVHRRVMSERTAEILRDAMIKAVTDGTGKKGACQYTTSAAKTGTAQTGIREDGRFILQAWYAGFFPAEQPRYVCVVLAENGQSGGGSAGPVFAELADALTFLSIDDD